MRLESLYSRVRVLQRVEDPRHGLAGLDEGRARSPERLPAQHRGVVDLHLRRVRLLHQALEVARVEVKGLSLGGGGVAG